VAAVLRLVPDRRGAGIHRGVAGSVPSCCQGFATPTGATRNREPFDRFGRLRLVAESYRLPPDREELVCIIEGSVAGGGEFVRRRVGRGEPAFVDMWERMGGQARYDRRRNWFAQHRTRFVEALG